MKMPGREMWLSHYQHSDHAGTHKCCENKPLISNAYDPVQVCTREELKEWAREMFIGGMEHMEIGREPR